MISQALSQIRSNNYGPMQHEEKTIPLDHQKCLTLDKIPIYGKGLNIRDWPLCRRSLSSPITSFKVMEYWAILTILEEDAN